MIQEETEVICIFEAIRTNCHFYHFLFMANWISDSCLIADISINKIQQSHVVENVFKLVVRKTFHNSLFNLSLVYSNQKKKMLIIPHWN